MGNHRNDCTPTGIRTNDNSTGKMIAVAPPKKKEASRRCVTMLQAAQDRDHKLFHKVRS